MIINSHIFHAMIFVKGKQNHTSQMINIDQKIREVCVFRYKFKETKSTLHRNYKTINKLNLGYMNGIFKHRLKQENP